MALDFVLKEFRNSNFYILILIIAEETPGDEYNEEDGWQFIPVDGQVSRIEISLKFHSLGDGTERKMRRKF